MKLAFCLFKYFPYGGLQRDFLRIARACIDRGHTVDAFCLAWQGPVPNWLSVTVLSCFRFTNHGRCRTFYRSLKPVLREGNYDLVVGFDKMPGLDVYYAADPCYRGRARGTHSWLYRLTGRYRHFSAFEQAVFNPAARTEILAISAHEQKNYEYYYGVPSERFHLLPPGVSRDFVPPENFEEQRAALREELFPEPDRTVALFVGSNFKLKGLDRVIRAMAGLSLSVRRSFHLHVLGQDNEKRFQKLANKLDVDEEHLRFWGGQDHVPRFFWAADLLIHPAYSENTGTVLLEALVAGLPVIATDVCGYAHYIRDAQAGIVISSPFSITSLAAGLEYMLVPEQRALFAQNAQRYVSTHDLYSLPVKAAEVIEQCARSKSKRKGDE